MLHIHNLVNMVIILQGVDGAPLPLTDTHYSLCLHADDPPSMHVYLHRRLMNSYHAGT